MILAALTAGVASGWSAEEPPGQKSRREKALADLDKEVGKLKPLVTKVDTMVPCASPAAPKPRAGKRPTIRAVGGGGAPFCPEKYTKEHKPKLQELIGVVSSNSGSDLRAGSVISFWPTYVVSFESRLVDLANLKINHKSAATVGQQCKATSDAMIKRAKAALTNKSLDDFDEARLQATKDQTLVREWVQDQESMQGSMTQWERNVRLFDPVEKYDNAWKPVKQALHASGKAMLDQWNADWAQAKKDCAEPLLGENHAEHRKLEVELYEALKKQLEDDLTTWRESAKDLYRHDCTSMQQLQKDVCEQLDGDGEDEDLQKQVEDQADKMKAEMENKVHAAWTELAALRSRAGRLGEAPNGRLGTAEASTEWRAKLSAFADEVKKEEDMITAVMSKGIGRGARNPKIQLWINFGKQQHSTLEDQEQFQCALTDQPYCATREDDGDCEKWKRPDCVNVRECKIWEFKPPGDRPKSRGNTQLNEYKSILEKHYTFALGLSRDHKLTYTPVGGMTFFRELERNCVKGDTVTFDTALHQYEKCQEAYECAPQAK